jgi:hypothetical protein
LRDEHIYRVSDYGMLMRIFGPKTGEGTGGWRKLHDEELHTPNRVINTRRVINS